MVWLSLVPPLPALAISGYFDSGLLIIGALSEASWLSIAGAVYLGAIATTFAYGIWGGLLTRYPVAEFRGAAYTGPSS